MSGAAVKNVLITGASSGIGRAVADLLVQHGHQVWGTSRCLDRLAARANFHAVEMRLDDAASIESAWGQTLAEARCIDVVVQNAGGGIFGAIEDVPHEQSHALWQVLVEGPLQLFQLAARHMRPRREGLIVGVSSLAAELPMPFSAHYSAGKSALSALLAGLSMELKPFDVRVVDLRPGDIRTAFNDDIPRTLSDSSPYFPWADRAWTECLRLMAEAPGPELVARDILWLLNQENPPAALRVGTFFQAKLGPLGVRILPLRALLKSIRQYYGLHKIDERQRPRD